MSLAVRAGRLTLTPGRLMWRRLPSLPSVRTSHSTLLPALAEHLHFDGAVVDEHDVADVDVVDEVGVVDVHGAFLLAAFAADGEGEFLAGLEVERHAEVAGADGRALRVHHDADELTARGGGGADVLDDAADPVVRRVRHVEAEDVHAGLEEPGDHFRRIGRRAKRGDDFGFADGTRVAWRGA